MRADTIEGTGAKPGDHVRCVKDRDGINHRFFVGQVYRVVEFCGKPGVFPMHGEAKELKYFPAMRGYGFEWELVTP
jgi:hypothetical protein